MDFLSEGSLIEIDEFLPIWPLLSHIAACVHNYEKLQELAWRYLPRLNARTIEVLPVARIVKMEKIGLICVALIHGEFSSNHDHLNNLTQTRIVRCGFIHYTARFKKFLASRRRRCTIKNVKTMWHDVIKLSMLPLSSIF